jgi:hypothetical protein
MQRRFSVPEPIISYTPRADAAPEVELAALAAIYKLCISSHAHRHAPGVTSTKGDDAKGSRHEVRADEASIQR